MAPTTPVTATTAPNDNGAATTAPVKPPKRKYQPRLRAPDPATENPALPIYQTTCFVCKEEAKSGETHSIHYGGIVCLSCRAFFRRSHQNTKVPAFKCKKKENCVVNTSNRRRCQRCRYNRCVRAGMKPEAVLTEDQKKLRFRKVYMKKSLTQTQSSTATPNESQENEETTTANDNDNDSGNEHDSDEEMDRTLDRSGESTNDFEVENLEQKTECSEQQPNSPWSQFDAPVTPFLTNPPHSQNYENSEFKLEFKQETDLMTPSWNMQQPNPWALAQLQPPQPVQHIPVQTSQVSNNPFLDPNFVLSHYNYHHHHHQHQHHQQQQHHQHQMHHPQWSYNPNRQIPIPQWSENTNRATIKRSYIDDSNQGNNSCSTSPKVTRYNEDNDSTVFVVPRSPQDTITRSPQDTSTRSPQDTSTRSPQDTTTSTAVALPELKTEKTENPSSWPVIDLSDSPPDSVESSDQNSCSFTSNQNSSPPSFVSNQIVSVPAPDKSPGQLWLHAKDEDLTDNESCEQIDDRQDRRRRDSLEPSSPEEDLSVKDANLTQKIDGILKTHFIAIRQMETPSYTKIVAKLAGLHSGETSAFKSISRAEILAHMINMSERFRHFALLQRHFCRLPKNDQRLLLARNSSLYIQLYMGCFFGAPSGAQQKELIRKYQIITRKKKILEAYESERRASERFIDMYQFNSITRLFRQDADLDYYIDQIEIFKELKLATLESRAIVSYLILFDYDESLQISCRDTLRKFGVKQQELYNRFFGKECKITIKDVMNNLVKMSVFGAHNIQWDDVVLPVKTASLASFNVVMAYTDEEEAWLRKQLTLYDDIFSSVPFGEDLMKEAMMKSLGVPLSKTYMKKAYVVFLERFWRVAKFNPELACLSVKDGEHLRANCRLALGIFVSKLEHCNSGYEQVQLICAEPDMVEWKETYLPLFNINRGQEVKKLTMETALATSSVPLTRQDMSEFQRISSNLAKILVDPFMFKIIALIVLTHPCDDFENDFSAISRLHYQFCVVLQRRMEWLEKSRYSFNQIMNALKDLPRLAIILDKIIQE